LVVSFGFGRRNTEAAPIIYPDVASVTVFTVQNQHARTARSDPIACVTRIMADLNSAAILEFSAELK
jgi:hypothetical protein